MAPLLQVEKLTVTLEGAAGPLPILTGLDFDVAAGESLGLVGESGCGKSMTALALLGLLPPGAETGGRILFQGQDLLGLGEDELCRLRGHRLAMIFQEPMTALNPVKAIGHQVAEGLRLHLGLSRANAAARAAQLLDRVGLPPARFPLSLYPHQLSGGQRQRVGIAMALACEPALLIADEPTTALDVTLQAQILDLIAEVTEEFAMALLMITHDLGVVARTTDRMLVMYAGAIAECGPTAAVFARMAHPYSAGLFAAMPQGPLAWQEDLTAAAVERPRLRAIPGQVPDPAARPPGCSFAPRCSAASVACRQGDPPATEMGPGHVAFCHHPLADLQGEPA